MCSGRLIRLNRKAHHYVFAQSTLDNGVSTFGVKLHVGSNEPAGSGLLNPQRTVKRDKQSCLTTSRQRDTAALPRSSSLTKRGSRSSLDSGKSRLSLDSDHLARKHSQPTAGDAGKAVGHVAAAPDQDQKTTDAPHRPGPHTSMSAAPGAF
ncbi:hypothetical protein MRX96_016154 [Rhipicephalus microplus]